MIWNQQLTRHMPSFFALANDSKALFAIEQKTHSRAIIVVNIYIRTRRHDFRMPTKRDMGFGEKTILDIN